MQTLGLSNSTPKPTSRLRDLFRPDLSSDIQALTVCQSAAWACFIVAALTAALAVYSAARLALIDAAMFTGVGVGLREGSRAAAVWGFVLYLIEQAASIAVSGIPSVMSIFIIVILFNGIRASYAHHRFLRTPPPLP